MKIIGLLTDGDSTKIHWLTGVGDAGAIKEVSATNLRYHAYVSVKDIYYILGIYGTRTDYWDQTSILF